MFKIVATLIALGFLTFPALAADQKVLDAAKTSIQISNNCSGVVIRSDRDEKSGKVETLILTAKHCVVGETKTTVRVENYDLKNRVISTTVYEAKVKGSSYKSDLALLELKDQNTVFESAKIAKADAPIAWGDDVVTIGFPMGFSKTLTAGNLGFVEDVSKAGGDFSDTNEFYRATPNVVGGSSGSPLFRENLAGDLEVIGLLTAAFPRATFMAYYTPIEEINEYLDIALKKIS